VQIGQKSALTGQGPAPCDGRVTILPPDPNLKALRLKLARLRAERNLTYDALAEASGLSRRTLIEIEQGRTIGTLATWHALAHALGVSVSEITSTLCEGHNPPA
jgi:putative transcriptional regulator